MNIIVFWECRAQQNYPLLSSEHCNLINTASGHIKTFWGQLNYGIMMHSALTEAF